MHEQMERRQGSRATGRCSSSHHDGEGSTWEWLVLLSPFGGADYYVISAKMSLGCLSRYGERA